ncbi:MAG TPA: single-stranded-DNA-specific exonuclease RecJ [Candidatus Enterousia intestinigallinarum]|uniref:Single-stranded-DNA-specific exonuclease RecJ n=1 Tax=Candidatus Enterousia intestinigallinarum TaxID=2840790 RepID=A0A9D1JXS3_9PROT|nr:single-stranded-DNA-specific exonuclease RecJ [Candidatus Enterousia intestinigallinarum]
MRKVVEKSILGQVWAVATYPGDDNSPSNADNLVQKILISRGVTDMAAMEKFLNPCIKDYMPNPSVMRDMDVAAKIIADSILNNDKIAIYGDYDVDGITSTAIFVKYLRSIGADVVWHLPTREGEGYGLNTGAIDEIARGGARLIITVDCGISGVAEVAYAKSLGLRVVVTDHHSPDAVLPAADAVVNPKRADDTSGLSYLAGVGVAFLTLVATRRELRARDVSDDMARRIADTNPMNYLDLVALGTICDTMPLVGLNRAFVATGLKVLGLRNNLGLRTLMDVAGIKKPSVYAAGFALGPRLNAAGRLDSAAPALELLLTDNPLIANDLAHKLHQMNQDRIDIQNAIMVAAGDMAQKCCDAGRCSLFVCGDNWHGGVMGIIAGRLKDKYNLPSCVATRSDGVINGSGRSIPGVDLGHIIHDALAAGIVSEGGGHAAAAGFSLSAENEGKFCEFLEQAVRTQLNGVMPHREIVADAEMDAGGATLKLVNKLNALAPFGQGNPEPTLILNGATLRFATTMGGGAHLRGSVATSAGTQLAFVGFNLVGTPVGDFLLDDANANTKIMLLGKLKENEYNGHISAQFFLEDIAV